ncbi:MULTISPECIES: hypothetical protein [Halomonadaceae]|uniref:hypothetical protein n=1 Tax=Halomonadaceae TaxID=28256 RepID=UPI001583F6B6|nr:MULTISPECIES: hypothetical protein [Halomonas]MDI4635981.1 hypothetical protein [Halomonas sp. BMC7]NUJ60346.1 hypothetical protein [Halomonas taeanensis]
MSRFTYKRGFVEITEVMDDEDCLVSSGADVFLTLDLLLKKEEATRKPREKGCVCLLMPSYVIDLRLGEDEIFGKIHRSTRRNIIKANKKGEVVYNRITNPSDSDIIIFCEFYNRFAKEVGIKRCAVGKLKAIRDQGELLLTSVSDKSGRILCSHAHLINGKQAYGIYSALLRSMGEEKVNGQLIGMANKYLDWKNIVYAKKWGCDWYNFGGKILDPKDAKGQGVNDYKIAFGSQEAYDFRVYTSRSLLGKAFIFLLHYYYRKKRYIEYGLTKEVLGSVSFDKIKSPGGRMDYQSDRQ